MGPRSPLRSGRRRADIPRMSCAPSSAWLRLLWGRCPWFKVSPPARSLQNRRPPGRLATRLPQGFGYCVAGAPWFKVSPPARSARGMRSPGPHSPHLPQGYGRCVAGAHGSKVSASVGAEQTSSRCLAVSALLLSLQNRRPPDVLRSPLRFGRRRADIPRMSCAPSSTRLWSLRGRLSIMIRQER